MSIAPYTREEIEIHKAVEGVGSGPKDRSIPYPGSIALRWLATVDARDAEIERLRERVAVENSARLHAERVLAETGGNYLRELDRVEQLREALREAMRVLTAFRRSEIEDPILYCRFVEEAAGRCLVETESALNGDPTKETT